MSSLEGPDDSAIAGSPSTFKTAINLLSGKALWTSLGAIGNRPVARLVILIPLIGYWIIFNKSLQGYAALWWDNVYPLDTPMVPWKLLSTYFGLCFVAVASLLYELFCPRETKQYSSAQEYSAARYDFISELEFERIKVALDKKGTNDPSYDDLMIDIRPGADTDTRLRLQRRNNLVLLDMYFDLCNRSKLTMRICAKVLYVIGFLALSVPAISIFLRVCSELYHSAVSS